MWYNLFFQRMEVAFITCTGMGGGRGTEPSMALFKLSYATRESRRVKSAMQISAKQI